MQIMPKLSTLGECKTEVQPASCGDPGGEQRILRITNQLNQATTARDDLIVTRREEK